MPATTPASPLALMRGTFTITHLLRTTRKRRQENEEARRRKAEEGGDEEGEEGEENKRARNVSVFVVPLPLL